MLVKEEIIIQFEGNIKLKGRGGGWGAISSQDAIRITLITMLTKHDQRGHQDNVDNNDDKT